MSNETIQITGSVKGGKLILDPSVLNDVAGGGTIGDDPTAVKPTEPTVGTVGSVRPAGGDDPYVAVNAPFDPIAEAA